MNTSEVQKTIQEQSGKCIANLEQYENDFQNALTGFLKSNQKNCLLVETTSSKLSAIHIMHGLKQLKETEGNKKPLSRYLGEENQTFLHWKQLLDIARTTKALPTFTNLLVCMFPDHESMKIDADVVYRIIERLKIAVLKKIVFITSQKDILDEFLRDIDTTVILKIDEFGKKIPSPIWDENKALLDKAFCGDVNGVAQLLNDGVQVNVTSGEDELTALHVAAENGHKDVVLTLLRNGADILPNKAGENPLHIAVRNGFRDIVSVLVENDGDILAENDDGETALHFAAEEGHNDLVKFLLERGAAVNAHDSLRQTPLNQAAANNGVEVIHTLLSYGADINRKGRREFTPLHCATLHDQIEAVNVLLEKGADARVTNEDGNTVLQLAEELGHNRIVLLLKNVNNPIL